MKKYQERPVIVEAFQMTKKRRISNADWPNWLHLAWQKNYSERCSVNCEDFPNSNGKDHLVINTLEGVMRIEWNDWIIQGVQGELYPCKPDIFELTYEEVK